MNGYSVLHEDESVLHETNKCAARILFCATRNLKCAARNIDRCHTKWKTVWRTWCYCTQQMG